MTSSSLFKFTANQARMVVVVVILLGSAAADASEFHAYYTRLGFADAPEATLAAAAVPTDGKLFVRVAATPTP